VTIELQPFGPLPADARRDHADARAVASSKPAVRSQAGSHDDPDLRVHLSRAARAALEEDESELAMPVAPGSSADPTPPRSGEGAGPARATDSYRAPEPARRGLLVQLRA
jgi:hypothetical protein